MAGTEPLSRATISSVKVFHSPHEGQRPSHLGASNPQFLQKYAAWSINVLMYVGCLGILVAIALVIWKRYLHTIYAE